MTPVELSAVIVHYRAAELAAEAIARLRAELETLGAPFEVLVVDNGSDAAGRRILESLPARLLEPGGNLGYAAGANRGVAAARGRFLLVMNPDVLVLPGCCRSLAEALAAGAAAAGPRFFWDEGRRLLLPPPEERGRGAALLRALAPRSPRFARAARRRWRRHARTQWSAGGPISTAALSGALLAIRRDAWERVGPFDEGYRLYFEETDWLHRLAGLGLEARFVPAAEAVHLYDRSASTEPRSREWFAASERRFRRRRYGRGFAALLSGVDRLAASGAAANRIAEPSAAADLGGGGGPGGPAPALAPGRPRLDVAVPEGLPGPYWVELSPSPLGLPAAAERLVAGDGRLRWELPEEIWERLEDRPYRLTLTDADGGEWGWFRVAPGCC
jgi:GT2 family glycosyltransferase